MKSILIMAFAISFSSAVQAATIPKSKAAELAIHRIERLVTLNKIEENFVHHFNGISIVSIEHANPVDPAFKASGNQVPGADGKSHVVEILLNETGKALSQSVIVGSDSANPPTWPNLDAVALAENSMHYLLDNAATKPELQPFYTDFVSLMLTQADSSSGSKISRATILSSATNQILEIELNLDGSFVSANVRNP